MKNNNSFLLLALSLMFSLSCMDYNQDLYEELVVVESYLVAGKSLPAVRVSTTGIADEFYDFSNQAVTNANVRVFLMDEANPNLEESSFEYIGASPGLYLSLSNHQVIPRRRYKLEVNVSSQSSTIRAYTIVPGTFEVNSGVQDTLVYQSSEQLIVNVGRSFYPNRQNIYIFNTLAADTSFENLTPFYASFYDEGDSFAEFANTSSGLLNEANFEVLPDNTVDIFYPWIAVAFYGDNQIVASAVDDNIYDFTRSQSVQLGGTTLSPGEIQNVIYNIENGIGIFGSFASDTISTFIKPNPALNQ